jgi:hypothetical protein
VLLLSVAALHVTANNTAAFSTLQRARVHARAHSHFSRSMIYWVCNPKHFIHTNCAQMQKLCTGFFVCRACKSKMQMDNQKQLLF